MRQAPLSTTGPHVLGRLLLLVAALALIASPLLPAASLSAASSTTEVRGLWVLRDSLSSAPAVERVVRDAVSNGFNTLFVQVRGRGDAYFRGGVEPLAAALQRDQRFDPLKDIVTRAHERGLSVHAWVNVNLVASARDLPTAAGHVVNRRPEWLMVPKPLAASLHGVSPRDPRYLARLADWSRRQADVEGLFASPILPSVAEYVAQIAADVVRRYPVDGVHLDYVRYPTAQFDYSAAALGEFRETVWPDLSGTEQARLGSREPSEPLVYVNQFPVRWDNFRRTRLTSLVMRVRTAVKAERPEVLLSAAVVPDSQEAIERRLQDWSLWFDSGLLDAICPMVYTPDAETFGEQIAALAGSGNTARIWTGIGAYRLTASQTSAHIGVARRAGMGGIVLFSYDSLRTVTSRGEPYLSAVRQLAFDRPQPTGR